jgi:hypothetical protein
MSKKRWHPPSKEKEKQGRSRKENNKKTLEVFRLVKS